MRRALACLALAIAVVGTGAANAEAATTPDFVTALVVLKSQADLSTVPASSRPARIAAVERMLRAHALRSQAGLLTLLKARGAAHLVDSIVPLWVADEIIVRAAPEVIAELAARPEVLAVRPDEMLQVPRTSTPATTPAGPVEPNVARVNAPALWDRGLLGQGIVVANMDTGVDVTHPDLASRWRGGSDSWYDPNGEHPTTPTDTNGHGTWTMGVMVGGDSGGSSIGVAPDARWIAVKIFNDQGVATSSDIHLGFQWLLDPDGNAGTADAPNVVNNSWSMSAAGCNLDFQLDLRSLRAAGILPVFAAGNDGPVAGSVFSPANLPEAYAVGGTDDSDALDPYSSRGPSSCTGATAPRLTAPDTGIRTSDLYGGYITQTGTSLAAPHAAGALALLLTAFPGLSVEQQGDALDAGALDLGPPGVDSDFGYGRLDVDASYQWLAASPDFTVAATPASRSICAGGSTGYAIQIGAVNGFSAGVSLSLSGLSASVGSASFSRAVVPGTGNAHLAITTPATAALGSYPLVVTGASGSTTHSAPIALAVRGTGFSVTASPAAKSISRGQTAAYTLSVRPACGFSGSVTLSVAGLPAHSSAVFSVNPVAANTSSVLRVHTTSTTPRCTATLTVTGTSGTLTSHVTVRITVG